jgi:hypothetical protein
MKHLKPFEDYSVNEEGKIANFFKGHSSSEERDAKVVEFSKKLDSYEEEAKNDNSIVFNRAFLEKQAKENNYKGHLEERNSARDGKTHIFYVAGQSQFQSLASTAAGSRNVS